MPGRAAETRRAPAPGPRALYLYVMLNFERLGHARACLGAARGPENRLSDTGTDSPNSTDRHHDCQGSSPTAPTVRSGRATLIPKIWLWTWNHKVHS